jgi:hypothetical protein
LTVNLAKTGSYTFYCPIDGHRQMGMKGTLVVGSSGGGGGGGSSTPASGSGGGSGIY